ncbi:UNVERIFIED_CONTAM: hypothetical protein FKN15_053163 [Acipenser sinensis]
MQKHLLVSTAGPPCTASGNYTFYTSDYYKSKTLLYSGCNFGYIGLYKTGSVAEIPDCKPWVEEGYWNLKRSNNAIIDEAYKQFNDVLYECKLLNNRASHVITQTERALSNTNLTKHYVL